MEILLSIYFVIGLLFCMERLSRVTKEDEAGMVSIGATAILCLWPLYIVYIIVKKKRNKNK